MRNSSTLLLLTVSALLLIPLSPRLAAQPTALIQNTWGGWSGSPESIGDRGEDVAVDSSGNIYVTGHTDSFGAGREDVVLLKYNFSGSLEWQRTWGGSNFDLGSGVVVDSSQNIYVTGTTSSFGAGTEDVFLLSFSSSGSLQWQTTWGGSSSDWGEDVAVDSSGDTYVTGYAYSLGEGVLLLKFDSSGGLQWQRNLGGGCNRGQSVAVDSSGHIYVAGSTCAADPYWDVLLSKFDSSGDLQWQRTWGGEGSSQYAYGVAVDSSDNIYVTGGPSGLGTPSEDVFLLKFDSSGDLQWQRTWDGGNFDLGSGVAVDSSGNIYVTGNTHSFGTLLVVLFKFDSSGGLQWQSTWSGGLGQSVVVDSSDNVYVTGAVLGPLPYAFSAVSGTLVTPTFPVTSGNSLPSVPTYTTQTPPATLGTPSGSESFAGGLDVFLLKLGPVSVTAPSAPHLNTMTPTNRTTIVLNWGAPVSDGGSVIVGYKLYRGTVSGGESLLASLGLVTSYTDDSVTWGVSYYYRVTAVNAAGESSFSNEASDTPFGLWYEITFGVEPSGSGTIRCVGTVYSLEFSRTQSVQVLDGHTYTCYANPGAGYRFSGWSGLASGSTNPVTFQVSGPGTLRAIFMSGPSLVLGLPSLEFYTLFGGFIGVIVTLTIVVQRRRRSHKSIGKSPSSGTTSEMALTRK